MTSLGANKTRLIKVKAGFFLNKKRHFLTHLDFSCSLVTPPAPSRLSSRREYKK